MSSRRRVNSDKETARRKFRIASLLENLEPRRLFSVYYDYEIVAQTGGEFTGFGTGPSINNRGDIAFVGKRAVGDAVYSWAPGGSPVNLSTPFNDDSSRTFNNTVQINDNGQVISQQRQATATIKSYLFLWDTAFPGFTNQLASGDGGGFGDFDAVFPFPSINKTGRVAYGILDGGVRKLATDTGFTFLQSLGMTGVLQPMVADNDTIVVRAGSEGNAPIRVLDASLNLVFTAAESDDFTLIGTAPGISDDGQVVVFAGDLSEAGAARLTAAQSGLDLLPMKPGPGIFATIKSASLGPITQRIAGVAGNGFLDPGERFIDANGNGNFDEGETDTGSFGSFNLDARVNVNATQVDQHAVTLAYTANDPDGNVGLFTSRLNFYGSRFIDFDTADVKRFSVSVPAPVIKAGETIPGLSGTVTNVGINDAINNRDRGDVVFWVDAGGSQAIVRARYNEVVYLDWDPKTNFKHTPLTNSLFNALYGGLVPEMWEGTFATLIAKHGRSDLDFNTIRNAVADALQDAFDDVDPVTSGEQGVNVKVIGRAGESAPTEGPFTTVYLGDSETHAKGTTYEHAVTGVLGISPIDIWNSGSAREAVNDVNGNGTTNDILAQDEYIFILLDEIFESGPFLNPAGDRVELEDTGPSMITQANVISAIFNVAAHELGHSMGLRHIDTLLNDRLMNSNPDSAEPLTDSNDDGNHDAGEPFVDTNGNGVWDSTGRDESRFFQEYGNEAQQLFATTDEGFVLGDKQNSGARLAFAVGSDTDTAVLAREKPSDAVIRSSEVTVWGLLAKTSVTVHRAMLGIIRHGDEHAYPEFIDLGSGNLGTLLSGKSIPFTRGDKVFLVASTTGSGIDIFGVPTDFAGDPAEIHLTHPLTVMLDTRIRGSVSDATGTQVATSLKLMQRIGDTVAEIGSLDKADPNALSVQIGSGSGVAGSVTFVDADGTETKVSLNRGQADILFSGQGTATTSRGRITITGTNLAIAGITLVNTTKSSSLKFTTKGGDGVATVGGISGDAPLKSISGSGINFTGTLNVGGLGSLKLNGITSAAMTIGVGGKSSVSIQAGAIVDSTLNSGIRLSSLKATSWTDTTGSASSITAPSISESRIRGDFQSDVVLTDANKSLGTMKVDGALSIGAWSLAGNVTSLSAGSIGSGWTPTITGTLKTFKVLGGGLGVDLSAGAMDSITITGDLSSNLSAATLKSLKVNGAINGSSILMSQEIRSLTATGAINNALIRSAGDIRSITAFALNGTTINAGADPAITLAGATPANIGTATLRSVTLKDKTGIAFSDSRLFAGTIRSANLRSVNTANAGVPFGLAATSMRSVSAVFNGTKLSLGRNQLEDQATLDAYMLEKGVSFGDFQIRLVV